MCHLLFIKAMILFSIFFYESGLHQLQGNAVQSEYRK